MYFIPPTGPLIMLAAPSRLARDSSQLFGGRSQQAGRLTKFSVGSLATKKKEDSKSQHETPGYALEKMATLSRLLRFQIP